MWPMLCWTAPTRSCSGETAEAFKAVAIMARTCVEAENEPEYTKAYETELAVT